MKCGDFTWRIFYPAFHIYGFQIEPGAVLLISVTIVHIVRQIFENWSGLPNVRVKSSTKKTPNPDGVTSQRVSNVGSVSMSWRHYVIFGAHDKEYIIGWALSYYSDLTLSQKFQPVAAQLSMKAAPPLTKILATASCRNSKTGSKPCWTSVQRNSCNAASIHAGWLMLHALSPWDMWA